MNNLMVIDGIEVRRDVYGRYSLNDLHRAAVASGANARGEYQHLRRHGGVPGR